MKSHKNYHLNSQVTKLHAFLLDGQDTEDSVISLLSGVEKCNMFSHFDTDDNRWHRSQL